MKHFTVISALFSLAAWASELVIDHSPATPLILHSDLLCLKPRKKIRFRPGKGEWKTQSSPKWEGPFDCLEDDKYCVYVNPHMNDGLILISHEKNVHVIDQFPVSKKYTHGSQPFYAAQIPGKGIGLIANTTIRKGETIMRTTPAILVQFGPHIDYDDDVRLELYRRSIQRLPQATRDMVLRQHGDDEFVKIDRNAFRIFINRDQPFSGHLGVYPDVSRLNHDCRPNIHYRMENITHISVAVRDIHPGEELTISYIDGHLPRKDRQDRLKDWGFTCTCPHCSMSAADIAASDARMERITKIEADLETMVATGTIDPTLGDELVALYEQEKFETYIGQAFTRAALLHSLVGNETMAVRYAGMAYEAMAREYGEWHKDTQAMKLLHEAPAQHWSWEALKKKAERQAKQAVESWDKRQEAIAKEKIRLRHVREAEMAEMAEQAKRAREQQQQEGGTMSVEETEDGKVLKEKEAKDL